MRERISNERLEELSSTDWCEIEEVYAMADELLERRAAERWIRLDSAPTDGTRIVLYCGFGYPAVVVFFGIFHPNSPGKPCWRVDYTNQPVHFSGEQARWRPLPEPPTKGESK